MPLWQIVALVLLVLGTGLLVAFVRRTDPADAEPDALVQLRNRNAARAAAPRKPHPLNITNILPIRQFILIRIIPEGMTAGGILLPPGVTLKNQALVVECGTGHVTDGGVIVPLAVQPGDLVCVNIPKGAPVIHRDATGDYALVVEAQVYAIDLRVEETKVIDVVRPKDEKREDAPTGPRLVTLQ